MCMQGVLYLSKLAVKRAYTMSEYTDYDEASKSYDTLRAPIAVEEIMDSILTHLGKPKSDIHVLDAGCGTGNYSLALLQAGIGKVSLIDASEGMLKEAKNKLCDFQEQNKVEAITQCLLPSIPFSDGQFDAVMFNFVLHHLKANDQDTRIKVTSEVLHESFRVLKSGGVLLILITLPDQYHGFWYANIVPEVTYRISQRFLSQGTLCHMLESAGFSTSDLVSILGSHWARNYYDAEGPLKQEWRNIDSYWSLFTDQELKTAVSKVNEMKMAGTLNQFMSDNDKSMSEGNIVLVKAVKNV